jgi:hypothetical protein
MDGSRIIYNLYSLRPLLRSVVRSNVIQRCRTFRSICCNRITRITVLFFGHMDQEESKEIVSFLFFYSLF